MPSPPSTTDKSVPPLRRWLRYITYDWTREMPRGKRILMYAGILLQGYAFYFMLMWAFVIPPQLAANFFLLPRRPVYYVVVIAMYCVGHWIQNGMLTSEFVRKTQLETDQQAARRIQQTLQPEKLEDLPGYDLQAYCKPLREVGGDYFDVVELPAGETLFALADVSGKGISAAMLAANIQALVRSVASVESEPLALANLINRHLARYTPPDHFATAVFAAQRRDSGELTYVNAGHNPPMLFSAGAAKFLEATGPPLGLFADAEYESRTAALPRGGTLLIFTDGLPDSIRGEHAENRIRDAYASDAAQMMANLKSLVDPKFNEDDVTILLIHRR